MRYEMFIAKRYLEASRGAGFISFINAFAIIGVTIGSAAVIIALSILSGFEKEIKEKVFGFTSHIQVVGFQGQSLHDYEHIVRLVKESVSEVTAVAPFVAREAMIRGRDQDKVDGILLKGIDPMNDIGMVRKYMVAGTYLEGGKADDQKLIIGKKLANKLDVHVGDRVVVFGLPRQAEGAAAGATMAQPRAMAFQISGIFESGMAEYDDIYAYTTLPHAQRLFRMGDNVSGYDVSLASVDAAPEIASNIQSLLGYPHYARTAAQLYRNLFAWIELQKKPAPILLGLIIIVATVNIIGTLLMLVLEKTREIGALRSLGVGPSGIRNIFLVYGVVLGVVGILFGNALAYGLCWVQITFQPFSLPSDIYFMSTVPILMLPHNFMLVSIIVLLLCISASLIPARTAAKLDPIAALRFG